MPQINNPINKMNQTEAPSLDYSLVITSCGRFDLLRRTVASFLKFADIKPRQYIIVEDSGDESVREILAPFDAPFEILINQPNTGQPPSSKRLHAAIDRAYAQVRFPYIFHCEDDWEFFRTGFIRESFTLMQALPKASSIMLRGPDAHLFLRKVSDIEMINSIRFCRQDPYCRKIHAGYSYNPGLRRLADYQKLAPLEKIKGGEAEVSYRFLLLEFATVHLEIPAVAHIGRGRRTHNRQERKRILLKLKKIQMRLHIVARWLLSRLRSKRK
ncbi:MAG: hypothetical protein M2R45_04144 [Verrucomicrobia subdivision 3 bacterium]|nr:hypothetical protein [Limisphaerales bacterium]MCS1417717.1 hypothetical protein [Limisphaerales bacterium]